MRKHPLYLLLLVAALTGCGRPDAPAQTVPSAGALPPENPLPVKKIARLMAGSLPENHLNHNKFNDTVATNALTLFIDSLDYDHSFFLATDIAEFQLQATQLDNQVSAGDITFAQLVLDRFKERVGNRVAYANQLLDKGFSLDETETYCWKRDKAPWPADETEWNELWRKKIKNDYVARMAGLEAEKTTKKTEKTNEVETASAATEKTANAVSEIKTAKILPPIDFVRERYKQYQLLIESNLDGEALLQRYLSAFTHSYDPHSEYLSPRGVEDFDINMSLSLVGIGATLRSEDGAAKIEKLIAGGPAEQDGRLQAGDKIIAVAQGDEDPVSILYWPLSKAVRIIRGEKGTKVVLTVIPADDAAGTRTKAIDLIRDEVKLEAQAAKSEIRELTRPDGTLYRIGLLTLPEFYADFEAARNGEKTARRASTDVRRILNEFATNRLNGIIFDLRNNGGGSLAEAIDIAGLFITLGPIVQVRSKYFVEEGKDEDQEALYTGPLVVLVNRLSASASEIVAAALQDYGRAVIVGDSKTHGKGTVQTVIPLSVFSEDLGSLKVTTASFYRITGFSTQLKGIVPDIVLPSIYDSLEIGEEYLDHTLPWSQIDSTKFRPWMESVKPSLAELQQKSALRMAGNPDFTTLLTRREQLRKRMENPEVSLKLTDRINEIVSETELENLQEEEFGDGKKDKDDPALTESLRILADLTELLGRKPAVQVTQTEPNRIPSDHPPGQSRP
ncbi:MAG: carboxy terminal-processing peptidase [Pontiellaceae bacterium]|jgi:carboxyl-terminal processing protease|nr:carboxy terminal-processing peptidase [Pontiellaceae bacterium]